MKITFLLDYFLVSQINEGKQKNCAANLSKSSWKHSLYWASSFKGTSRVKVTGISLVLYNTRNMAPNQFFINLDVHSPILYRIPLYHKAYFDCWTNNYGHIQYILPVIGKFCILRRDNSTPGIFPIKDYSLSIILSHVSRQLLKI